MYTLFFSKIRCLNMNNGMFIKDRCTLLFLHLFPRTRKSSLSTPPRFYFLSSPSSHPPAIHSGVYIASLASANGCIEEYTSCQRRQMHFGVPGLAVCANFVVWHTDLVDGVPIRFAILVTFADRQVIREESVVVAFGADVMTTAYLECEV